MDKTRVYRGGAIWLKQDQMTQIIEIAGIRKSEGDYVNGSNAIGKLGNARIPKRVFIPFSAISSSESRLLLEARKADVYGTLNFNKGFQAEAEQQRRLSDELRNVYAKGIHSLTNLNSRDRIVGTKVNSMIAGLKRLEQPALKRIAENGIGSCKIGLNSIQKRFIDNAIIQQIGKRPGFLASRRKKEEWQDSYDLLFQQQARPLLIDQIIDCHMEDSGAGLTYALWGNANYNQRTFAKYLQAEQWINNVIAFTGLRREDLIDLLKIGFAARVGETVENSWEQAIDNYLVPRAGINGIGEITTATIVLIINILNAVIAAARAIANLINESKQFKLINELQSGIPSPSAFKPDCYDPNVLPEVDPRTGRRLPCDLRTGEFKQPTNWLGYGLAAAGAFLLIAPSKDKK